MRLLVTGASGLLGLNLCLSAQSQGHDVLGWVHSQKLKGVPFEVQTVDLYKTEKALGLIKKEKPEAIIHCAAVANLHQAERVPELTWTLNADVPGQIAEAAYTLGIPFVHISTDAVFDGEKGGYVETDSPNPLSIYAKSKLAGEETVKELNPDALIARVVFYGWSLSGNRSLSEFFYNNLKQGVEINGFTDTFFSPLYVEDLSDTLLIMLKKNMGGVYHVVSPESLSKYDFGVRIAQKFGFDPSLIKPVKMSEIKRGAPRSLNLVLEPCKLQTELGYELPNVDSGIDRFYSRWEENYHLKLQNYSL